MSTFQDFLSEQANEEQCSHYDGSDRCPKTASVWVWRNGVPIAKMCEEHANRSR